jgi:DNA polymerase-1
MVTAGERLQLGSGRRLLLIDGHAYAYRAYHAIRELSSPLGRPTNAIFGFIKMVEKVRTWIQPTHLAVVWDGGLAQERLQALPEYKAQRPPMPDSLAGQLEDLAVWLAAAEITSCQREGVEADDWIAALASRAAGKDWSVVIASSDKDFMQLVSDRVRLLNPGDKTERLWGPDEVREKSGVDPEQIVDWLSLVGDAVDNIPGVRGVGHKTAAALLKQFGSIDAILGNLEQVAPDRIRRAVGDAADVLRRNRELVRLKSELGLELGPELDSLAVREGQLERMADLCSGWGFRSLRQELERRRAEPALLL